MRNWIVIGGTLALSGMLTAACGDSMSSTLPTGPSAVAASASPAGAATSGATSAVAGDVILAVDEANSALGKGGNGKAGNGNGNGNDNGKGKDDKGNDDKGGSPPAPPSSPAPPTNTSPGAPAPPTNPGTSKVEIEGVIASLAGLSLTVNGQAVLVPSTAVIRHGSRAVAFAELQVGDRVHIKAGRNSGGALEATEVNVQNPSGDGNDGDVNEDGSASVRVAVLDGAASETGADPGAFRLTRVTTTSLPVTSPLSVSFTLTGTALNGTDYVTVPLTATFLAGQATVDVVVTPIADLLAEGPETVVLTLTNASPYVLGTPTTATVTISEMPVVSVAAFDSSAAEAGLDTGTFRLTRDGSTAAPLTVTVTLTGTALNGTDYVSVPLTVTFLAGQGTADVVITPIADAVVEGPETVILSVIDGALYDLGTPSSATVTIAG